jgi:thiamine pyridinylase
MVRIGNLAVVLGALSACGGAGAPCPQAAPVAQPAPRAAPSPPLTSCAVKGPECRRRVLTVALYPYVPDFYRMFADAKAEFEKRHLDVEVVPVWLPNYYDSTAPDSIRKTEANVLEIDSVFLTDMLKDDKIVPLPADSAPSEKDFAPAAVQAARRDGRWIGSPHWLCSDFVYSTKAKPFTGATLKDLEQFVGAKHPDGSGLLVDMMGKSTLGELYLDALVDEAGTFPAALVRVPMAPEAAEVTDLQRLLGLCDAKYCRDQAHHDDPSGYTHEFAAKQGSALVGYSEATHDVLRALKGQDCTAKPGACISADDVVVSPFPLADAGAHPFVWVDTLAINKKCTDVCAVDAAAFIAMMNEDAHLTADLLPTLDVPRYLLPAKTTLDGQLVSRAPLYARFRSITRDAPPAMDLGLGDALHTVGGQITKQLKH